MKLLVLSGTRYMGREVANLLHANGHDVVTVTRSADNTAPWRNRVCDCKNSDVLVSVVSQERPDAILDMICFDASDARDVASLARHAAFESVKHYVMVSTFFIYNYSPGRQQAFAGDAGLIQDGYTRRKAQAESVLQVDGPLMQRTTIVRLPYVFSHDDYSGRFQRLCTVATHGGECPSTVWRTSIVSMPDAAAALVMTITGAPLRHADIADSGAMTLREMVTRLAIELRADPVREVEDPSAIYPLSCDLQLRQYKITPLRPLAEAQVTEAILCRRAETKTRGTEDLPRSRLGDEK
jgi:nucleoside-diphosphate-sugar epimerase